MMWVRNDSKFKLLAGRLAFCGRRATGEDWGVICNIGILLGFMHTDATINQKKSTMYCRWNEVPQDRMGNKNK